MLRKPSRLYFIMLIGTDTSGSPVEIADDDEIDTMIWDLGDDDVLKLEFLFYDGHTVTITQQNLTTAGERIALRDGAL